MIVQRFPRCGKTDEGLITKSTKYTNRNQHYNYASHYEITDPSAFTCGAISTALSDRLKV